MHDETQDIDPGGASAPRRRTLSSRCRTKASLEAIRMISIKFVEPGPPHDMNPAAACAWPLKPKSVVFLVGADPEPVEVAAALAGDGPVVLSNFRRMDASLFLEAERRVRRVFTEQLEILVRQFPNMLWELVVIPKGGYRV